MGIEINPKGFWHKRSFVKSIPDDDFNEGHETDADE
jgi:hypothetical protein